MPVAQGARHAVAWTKAELGEGTSNALRRDEELAVRDALSAIGDGQRLRVALGTAKQMLREVHRACSSAGGSPTAAAIASTMPT